MPAIKRFGDVYKDEAADLPLVNLSSLVDKVVVFHAIDEASTPLGDGYRMIVSIPGEEGNQAILSQPSVVTKQLLKAQKDRNLPIEATVSQKKGSRYNYFVLE